MRGEIEAQYSGQKGAQQIFHKVETGCCPIRGTNNKPRGENQKNISIAP
jgi:hypothetical protein